MLIYQLSTRWSSRLQNFFLEGIGKWERNGAGLRKLYEELYGSDSWQSFGRIMDFNVLRGKNVPRYYFFSILKAKRTKFLSLSLSSLPPLISPRGWYNGQVARLLSSILALFFRACSFVVRLHAFGWPPLDRKSSSIVRFFRKLAVPVLFGSKGDYTWRRFFFREREKKRGEYDRSRNFSTASGAEFWPFWDEYRSGFGWRRRN